ncbi:MAG TPA: addiction module protein [Bryobacteraceae bacterium]|jgi:hypothetical protein|nr:addiction module protein [Bryobacteraceae bacterium]
MRKPHSAPTDTLLGGIKVDADAEERWREEIRRRLEQIDSQTVALIPWDEARKALRSKLRR